MNKTQPLKSSSNSFLHLPTFLPVFPLKDSIHGGGRGGAESLSISSSPSVLDSFPHQPHPL